MAPLEPALLTGDVAVVTGAARGNGAAIARGLGLHGAAVVFADIDLNRAEGGAEQLIASGGRAIGCRVDVTERVSCAELAAATRKEFGAASIVVNNAGILRRGSLDAPGLVDDMQDQFRVNVIGPAQMVEAFLPQLRQTGGRIVNVGSIASYLATPGGAGYAASKGAVLQLTRTMAAELAPSGIRVNAIAPGVIVTEMTRETRDDPAASAALLAHTPFGRFGEPDELVGPVVFLASRMSSYVTGVMIPVDGGYLTK